MSGLMLLVALIILFTLLIIGIPVVFAFLGTTAFLIITLGYEPSFLLPYGYSQLNTSILLAIPMFIIAGKIMELGGIGNALVDWTEVIMGRLKGGLGIVTVLASAIFGSISGSAFAALSTIGSIMLGRLKENGYSRGFAAALVANSSILGLLIPPSAMMIVYAWLTNQSVLASFLSTVIPGIILVIILSLISVHYMSNKKRYDANPQYQTESQSEKSEEVTFIKKTKKFGIKSIVAIPGLLLPIIILGGIYGGIMTTTEAAAVAAVYSIPVGLWVYKGLKIKDFKRVFVEAATTTGTVMVILFSTMILSRMYVMENLPTILTEILFSISENTMILLMLINIFVIIVGMLMDDASAVLLITPILYPVAVNIGIDPIHLAAILGVNIGMGNITPPTAPLLYFGGQLAKAPITETLKPTLIMIVFAWIPTLVIVTYVPEVALFLPRLLLGY